MPGSFDLDNVGAPLVSSALSVAVFWYTPPADGTGQGTLELVPNVECLRIDMRTGPEAPTAQFRYRQSQALEAAFGWPSQFEDLWPIDAQGAYVVQPDDRIVVAAKNPDGSPWYLFDGFSQVPQADVSGSSQHVTFVAVGVAATASYDVIHTRIQRDASNPTDTSGNSDREIRSPCRFNPAGTRASGTQGFLPNSTPNANYTVDSQSGDTYPVFLDPLLEEREILDSEVGDLIAPWYLDDALLYLVLCVDTPGDAYISWPSAGTINQLTATLIPAPGQPFDPATATSANLVICDYDATNKPLPRVLEDLLGYAGFHYAWALSSDGDGNPETSMAIFRVDAAAAGPAKAIYLQPHADPGVVLDPAANNVAALHLARDLNGVVNAYRVETAPQMIECTIYLAPLFEPNSADAAPSSDPTQGWNAYSNATLALPATTATQRRKYRWFGADECGDGHFDCSSQAMSTQELDLTSLMQNPDGSRNYAVRYRPGRDTLVSVDAAGRPLRAFLEVQIGTASAEPSAEKDTSGGMWYPVTNGWKLLDDRLGIRVTVDNPEDWHTGCKDPAAATLRLISWLGKPTDPASKKLRFRLTTVIDADTRISADAPKRLASPTQLARWRSIDARDHFQYRAVAPTSSYYTGDGTTWTIVRDDTQQAKDHARQVQSAHEMPSTAGSVMIPFITDYYQLGDRIASIDGRNVGLECNVGDSSGESPVYPWVVGVTWSFEGDRQSTALQLSDRRGEANNSW